MSIKSINNKSRGFTLAETLVAIFILMFSLLGPLALSIYAIRASSVSKNEIMAYNLAQEAMEYVRNIRDANFLTGAAWNMGFINNCDPPNNVCTVDVFSGGLATCPSGVCAPLTYDPSAGANAGRYSQSTAAPAVNSIFTRMVTVQMGDDYDTPADGPDEMTASTTVKWREKGYTRSISLETRLFRWK